MFISDVELYKPEYITESIVSYYCTVTDADASIFELIFSNKHQEKNKIISNSSGWTYLHAVIWNGSWGDSCEKTQQLNCYKQLVTDQNIKITDNDGKTPYDLYKEIYSGELDKSIISLLKPE